MNVAAVAIALLIAIPAYAGERTKQVEWFILRESNHELLAVGEFRTDTREHALHRMVAMAAHMTVGSGVLPHNTRVWMWFKIDGRTYRIRYRTPQRRWGHGGHWHVGSY